MAREQQRHHLIADLPLGETLAVLIVGIEEQREHILPALPRPSPPRDLREEDAVELARGHLLAVPRAARAAKHPQGNGAGVERERLLEEPRGVHLARVRPIGIESKERAHGDAQSELARPRIQIHPPPCSKGVERCVGL